MGFKRIVVEKNIKKLLPKTLAYISHAIGDRHIVQ